MFTSVTSTYPYADWLPLASVLLRVDINQALWACESRHELEGKALREWMYLNAVCYLLSIDAIKMRR